MYGGIDKKCTGQFSLCYSSDHYRECKAKYLRSLSSNALFPILDSYPSILRNQAGDAVRDGAALTTSLTTDSGVMNKVKGLRSAVIRYIDVEEREVIGNELAEIAEGYKEGWSSGSDDDDD